MKPLSREFLLSRGYCCHNNCRNCPYEKDVGEGKALGNRSKIMTQQELKELFEYHEDGYLIWKVDAGSNKLIGKKAGSQDKRGRQSIRIGGKGYLTYRLIFLYHRGYLPEVVDHIDRDPTNNKIENLRAATQRQNLWNTIKKPTGKQSKYRGVGWHKRDKLWYARIRIEGKRKTLGYFKDELDAAKAYQEAAKKLHGEFYNDG